MKDYNRANLRTSDHRPVYAVFDATIREVDYAKKDAIARDLLRSVRTKAQDGKLDDKIQTAASGGISGVVKGMTNGE